MSERLVHKILIVCVPEQEEHVHVQVEEKLLQSSDILDTCACACNFIQRKGNTHLLPQSMYVHV